MKSTGVVRRIDDLGRIVIPKEIRRSLRIREGDSLEIYSNDDEGISLKKYSQVESLESFINQYVDAIHASTKQSIIITDTEKIIAASININRDVIKKKIDVRLDEKIHKLETQYFTKEDYLEITKNLIVKSCAILKPISIYGDVVGSVILLCENITEVEKTIAETSACFLSKYLEE